jgi:mannose-6-phosphate isomerase-like protein (cupin superfamily)
MSKQASRISEIRRIVTGHNATGRSIVLADGPSARAMILPGTDNFGVTDLWKTFRTPADASGNGDAAQGPISLAPPRAGSVFRVVEFPPDQDYVGKWRRDTAFGSMGESGSTAIVAGSTRHEGMHRTASVDYAIVIKGKIWAVLDTGEVEMGPGDTLIQRGTNHSWSNRSDEPCLMAFVLIDADPVALPAAG